MGEGMTPKYIRRSLYSLSIDDPQLGEKAYASWADAVVLDCSRRPGRDWQQDLRSRLPAAITEAARGGAEVFVRIDAKAAAAELEATVFSGISGVVLKGVSGPEEVTAASRCLDALELARGIARGSLEIDVEVDAAAAVWKSLEIARASKRFGTFSTNEQALSRNLGMSLAPGLEFEPLEYIKSQLITVATSVGGQAEGMSYPLSLTQEAPGEDELKNAVRRARDTGFKGSICPHASWIKACNEGFRPSPNEISDYMRVVELFADGLKRGMASVPMDGKMIDVPVDLRAKLYLEWARRAQARDEEKARAHAKTHA
jgi:citrate lyase subunit beta / citryl-CoA lyase